METFFGFMKDLKPDPLVDSEEVREILQQQGMHVQSTPTVRMPRDYTEVIYYGKKYETDEDGFTIIDHG